MTDRDLRSRVIAAGLSPDEPVSAIMTEPAHTVTADRLGGDVLLDMLERNVHHIPVLSQAGEVLGVVDDGNLVAAEGRKPLLLRRAIALAESPADLAVAAAGLDPMIIALHDARVAAEHVTAVRSVVLDALTRRLVELAVRDAGPTACAVHLVRARQPGAARGGAVLRRGQRAGLGRRKPAGGRRDRPTWPPTWAGWLRRWTRACGRAGCRPTRTARARPTRCSPGRWPPGTGPRGACPRTRPRRRR